MQANWGQELILFIPLKDKVSRLCNTEAQILSEERDDPLVLIAKSLRKF